MQEHQRLALEDAPDVASRGQAGEVAADRICRLAEETESHAQRLRLGMDLCRERMLLGEVAEQHCRVFSAFQRFRERRDRIWNFRRRHDALARDRHRPVVVHRVQHVDLRAALGRLAQAMRDQRMVLAQERAHHQHAIERAEIGDRHAEPRNAFAPAIGGEVGVAQAEIGRSELAGEVQLFERRMRRSEHAEVLLLQAPHGELERHFPVHRFPARAALHHRLLQPAGRIEGLIGKAVLVGKPALVDRVVIERQHAHHARLLHLHDEVRAEAIVRRNRPAPREFPGPRRVAKRPGGQGADRAQVDHVA